MRGVLVPQETKYSIITGLKEGKTPTQIAAELNISRNYIYMFRKRIGLNKWKAAKEIGHCSCDKNSSRMELLAEINHLKGELAVKNKIIADFIYHSINKKGGNHEVANNPRTSNPEEYIKLFSGE